MNKLVKLVLVGDEEVEFMKDMMNTERDIIRDRIDIYHERIKSEEITDTRREALRRLIEEETRTVNLCDNLLKQLGA
jgi:uncharacterized protein YbjQ (UPF0145 family)